MDSYSVSAVTTGALPNVTGRLIPPPTDAPIEMKVNQGYIRVFEIISQHGAMLLEDIVYKADWNRMKISKNPALEPLLDAYITALKRILELIHTTTGHYFYLEEVMHDDTLGRIVTGHKKIIEDAQEALKLLKEKKSRRERELQEGWFPSDLEDRIKYGRRRMEEVNLTDEVTPDILCEGFIPNHSHTHTVRDMVGIHDYSRQVLLLAYKLYVVEYEQKSFQKVLVGIENPVLDIVLNSLHLAENTQSFDSDGRPNKHLEMVITETYLLLAEFHQKMSEFDRANINVAKRFYHIARQRYERIFGQLENLDKREYTQTRKKFQALEERFSTV